MQSIPKETVEQIQLLRHQRVRQKDIAFQLGISITTVRRHDNPRVIERKTRTYLTTHINGIKIRHRLKLWKRPKPSNCELCNKSIEPYGEKLYWHHWDNEHLELGLWLCYYCHRVGNIVEKGEDKRYLELKEKAIREGL